MREGLIAGAQNLLYVIDVEDANASSYASGTGLFLVVVIAGLSVTGLSLMAFAH